MYRDINIVLGFKVFDLFWILFLVYRKIVYKILNRISFWNDYCFNYFNYVWYFYLFKLEVDVVKYFKSFYVVFNLWKSLFKIVIYLFKLI